MAFFVLVFTLLHNIGSTWSLRRYLSQSYKCVLIYDKGKTKQVVA